MMDVDHGLYHDPQQESLMVDWLFCWKQTDITVLNHERTKNSGGRQPAPRAQLSQRLLSNQCSFSMIKL